MAAIGNDPEYGRILAVGKQFRWQALIAPILPLIFIGSGVFAYSAAVSAASKGTWTVSPASMKVVALGLMVFGLVQAPFILWWIRKHATEMRFFEQGVALWRQRRGDIRRLSYLDVAAMTYTLSRSNLHGVHVGTSGVITLQLEEGSKQKGVRYAFQHREKAKGIFNRRFEGVDPMDLVRDAVAEAVAERLALEIAEKGEATWTGPTTFTKEGLRIKKLLGPPITMDYAKIDRLGFGDGNLVLFEEGSKRGFVSMAVNGKNFWPGFVLFQRLMTPRGGAEEIEGGEFEEEGD